MRKFSCGHTRLVAIIAFILVGLCAHIRTYTKYISLPLCTSITRAYAPPSSRASPACQRSMNYRIPMRRKTLETAPPQFPTSVRSYIRDGRGRSVFREGNYGAVASAIPWKRIALGLDRKIARFYIFRELPYREIRSSVQE